jgi:hypothetical protein
MAAESSPFDDYDLPAETADAVGAGESRVRRRSHSHAWRCSRLRRPTMTPSALRRRKRLRRSPRSMRRLKVCGETDPCACALPRPQSPVPPAPLCALSLASRLLTSAISSTDQPVVVSGGDADAKDPFGDGPSDVPPPGFNEPESEPTPEQRSALRCVRRMRSASLCIRKLHMHPPCSVSGRRSARRCCVRE